MNTAQPFSSLEATGRGKGHLGAQGPPGCLQPSCTHPSPQTASLLGASQRESWLQWSFLPAATLVPLAGTAGVHDPLGPAWLSKPLQVWDCTDGLPWGSGALSAATVGTCLPGSCCSPVSAEDTETQRRT